MMKAQFHVVMASLFAFQLLFAGLASAQSYPSKPVRIIVGYSGGGGVDTTARLVAAALTELWDTQVLVENLPGGTGNRGNEITARAAPDGYTLVLCNLGSHGVTPALFAKHLTYDPIRDFAFLGKIGGVPSILMVHPSVPIKTLRQYIAYAKANPGKLKYGSAGVGGSANLMIELLKSITGTDILHVPYKGGGAALTAVMGGQIESSIGNLAGAPLAAIKSGRVRGLAVTSGKRSSQLPNVPTFQEQGVPGYDVVGWYGLCTQSKVPQPIITKINADMNKLLVAGTPLRKRLQDQAIDVSPGTPEEFAAFVEAEITKWTKVAREAKLQHER